jgi:membrane protein
VIGWRRRSGFVDLVVGVAEGWQRHRTGPNAALVAYFGFVSVFPLLAVMVTVLGWVLAGNDELREDIVDSTLTNLPIIGQQIESDPSAITGSLPVFVIGLLTALWAGTRAFAHAQRAMDDIWEVDDDERPNILGVRGRALLAAAVVGTAQVVSATVVTVGLAGVVDIAILSRAAFVIGALIVNVATLALIYRILPSRSLHWRAVAPGALVAGAAITILQFVGTAVVGRAIAQSSDVYGTFATVIALVFWLSLHASATFVGAELNAYLEERRGPTRYTTAA